MLSAPIAAQRFKAIARGKPQIVELTGCVDGEKPGSRLLLNLMRNTLDRTAGKQCRRAFVGEALDHEYRAYRKSVRRSRNPI